MAATVPCSTKRLLSFLLAASLVLPRPGFAAPAEKLPYCLVSFEKMNTDYLGLGRGDLVTIGMPDVKGPDGEVIPRTTRAYFVGTLDRWSSPRTYLFIEKDTGTVFTIKGAQLEIAPELKTQTVPRISCQLGGTCAVYSTFMGLKFLNSLGQVKDPVTQHFIERQPVELMMELLRTPINASVHEYVMDRLNRRERQSFPSQSHFRVKTLLELGVEAKLTFKSSAVKEHLEKGLPVILDLRIRRGMDRTLIYQKDGTFLTDEALSTKIDDGERPDMFLGRHSVLAVGFIPYGPFKGKLLVLDSADGAAHLWEYSDLEKTKEMRATLLGPNDKITESEVRAKIVDFWKNNHTGQVIVGGVGLTGLLGLGAYFMAGDDEKARLKKEEEEKKKKEAEKKAKEAGR